MLCQDTWRIWVTTQGGESPCSKRSEARYGISSSPTNSPVRGSEICDVGRLYFVLSQSHVPLILQIPKLFTFPHPALSRENVTNSSGEAENIKVYRRGRTRVFYWGDTSSLISQGRMAMLKTGCSARSLHFVCVGMMKGGRGLAERRSVVISAEEWLPGLYVSKGGALLVSLAAKAELKKGRGQGLL